MTKMDRERRTLGIPARLRAIRTEHFGDDVETLARALGIPPATWLNYEQGVVMPAEIMLYFLTLTGTDSSWMLDGKRRL
jgi:hypothetical protein